jgi:hypothetical protein
MISPAEAEALGRSLVHEYSELLRRPGSRAELRWPQALALHWLHEHRGLYCGLPPGEGKTLITMLAPVVLDARQPALIAPATLHRDKTTADFARYQRDWTPHYKSPTLLNLEAMSLDQNLFLLDKLKPDLVMVDECDLLRNPESAAFVRLDRYRTAAPHAAFMLLTGSGMRFGIDDYDVHLCWCLPHGGAPVPYDEEERGMWREALRAKPKGRPSNATRRPRAGVLLELCALPHERGEDRPRTELEQAQAIVARRINHTPGVMILNTDDCQQPVEIRLIRAPDDPVIDADFAKLYGGEEDDGSPDFAPAWCLPNDEPVTDGLQMYRVLRSLGCGYYEFTDPPPPEEWAIARRRYARKVRKLIEQSAWSDHPADTPRAVERAFPKDPVVLEWQKIKPTFKPRTSIHRQSDSVIQFAVKWMRVNRGIVWCGSVPMARWIAKAAGVRYYGAGGCSADGALLDDIPAGEAAVASIKANGRGRNIQDRHHTGLAIQLPQSADECHQLFKRYARSGQPHPVRWDVLITSGAAAYSFDMAKYEAGQVKKMRKQVQTILRADISYCTLDPNNPRWQRKPAPI